MVNSGSAMRLLDAGKSTRRSSGRTALVRILSVLLAAVGAITVPAVAFAVEVKPATTSLDATAPVDNEIQEIVVTARRRTESLQRTALAINAVDGQALRNAGVIQPQDISKLVPALQLAPIGGSGTQVTIRGVGNFAPFLYSEPAVAINYDGIYLARSAAPNGLFFDLDRIEVLKGPQGTLYGRNATGGAINIVTSKPELDAFHSAVDLDVGNFGRLNTFAMVNLPLGASVALRIAAQSVDRRGYLSDGYLDDKDRAVRAQLLWIPAESWRVTLEADHIYQGGRGPGAVFVTPSGYLDPAHPWAGASSASSQALLRNASLGITEGADPAFLPPFGTDGYTHLNIRGTAATIENVSDIGTLTLIPSYRHTENDFKHYAGGFPLVSTEDSSQKTLEMRLASNGESPFQWVTGVYYFQDSSGLYADADQGIAETVTIAPSLPTRSVAAFAHGSFSLTDRLRLTGGLRYTNERKTQTGENTSDLPPVPAAFPGPPSVFYGIACPSPASLNIAGNTCTAPFAGRVTFDQVTWKVGIELDAAPDSMIYLNAETGFKAGGFYPSLAPNTYKPEKLLAMTLGSKNRFLGNTLQVNAEAFYWKYRDKQVSHLGPLNPAGYAIITQNAGQATIFGAETDVLWHATRNDTLSMDLQYLHSRYNSFLYNVPLLSATQSIAAVACPQAVNVDPNSGARSAQVDCSGNALPQSPRFTFNVNVEHIIGLPGGSKLAVILGSRLESAFYVGEEFLPGEYQGSSHVSYGSLSYRAENDSFSVGAYIDNIENQAVKASNFVQPAIGLPLAVLRPPRTYGLRLGYRL